MSVSIPELHQPLRSLVELSARRKWMSYEELNTCVPDEMVDPEKLDELLVLIDRLQVDFIDEFRFLGNLDGFPEAGGTYTFTLLNVHGQPIAGATTSDTWLACTVDAPRNVSATVEP